MLSLQWAVAIAQGATSSFVATVTAVSTGTVPVEATIYVDVGTFGAATSLQITVTATYTISGRRHKREGPRRCLA